MGKMERETSKYFVFECFECGTKIRAYLLPGVKPPVVCPRCQKSNFKVMVKED